MSLRFDTQLYACGIGIGTIINLFITFLFTTRARLKKMDIFDIFLQSGLITGIIVLYLLFLRKQKTFKGNYKGISWNYPLKLLWARYAIRRWKSQLPRARLDELPCFDQFEGWDGISVRTTNLDGTTIWLSIRKLCGRQPLAEIVVHVKLPDGTTYRLQQHPDTAVSVWENTDNGWSAGGLKIQVTEAQSTYRFLFNGLMTRVGDNVTQHVKLNLVWMSACKPVSHPHEWSNELAAEGLALEPWRDNQWPFMLGKFKDGGWHQWGVAQGRFQSFDEEGVLDKDVYLRTRGIKERSWAPCGYQELRRSITITASAKDGTAIQLRLLSYKNILTHCVYGTIRFPDCTTRSITSSDLVMSDFCERPDGIPNAYNINVSTKRSDFNIMLRINNDGGNLFSGVPYQQEIVYRTLEVTVNCEPGTGLLELGYEPTVTRQHVTPVAPLRILKWLSEKQAGEVNYCLPFEDYACRCPAYVGGKGASLALLASVQKDEGYRVPPGFSLTIKALEKHLEVHPQLKAAIQEIEAANYNYNEDTFKEKCNKASELFNTTEIDEDVKKEILDNMRELRLKATEQNLGPELRFAVRSSAVGEDSEELSAAGQNETILGCISDADVLEGVQRCWGSMFAFTSAYYRRQNGQPCFCGGGVVVQVLVTPRAAGVMFTRHPAHGDPSRLLITANYGLGESVVSGSVEPDTVIVKRESKDKLAIIKTELGSKSHRVKTEGSGIAMEDVPEGERNVACLTDEEVLKLARLGVVQEELWGAGRDIEWAVTENEIYLLQARPITSLDRWTEEELLHELDTPTMSDEDLISFGNTGEVLPKPVTPMTYDLVIQSLTRGMDSLINTNDSGYDNCITLTHNRCGLSLYNCVYRIMGKEIDIKIRMIEMAIHGHKVADSQILKTALHRREQHWTDQPLATWVLIKSLFVAKSYMTDAIETVNSLNYLLETDDPKKLFKVLEQSKEMLIKISSSHSITTTASTGSQILAMLVYLEGKQDFTPEQCNEIGGMFTSGDVLSAEVPSILAKIVQTLETFGLAEEFRAQDPKTAMQWLKKNTPGIYLDVCVFLEHHGYRAIMEFDFATKPWVLVPEEMMKVLQNLRVSSEGNKNKASDDQIVNALNSPEKSITRTLLRWILPLCRRTVRQRESTKAHLILLIHKVRLGFLQLGKLLVRKWYIPNVDLVFFFRLEELKNHINNRDPALLKKAIQRQQNYQGWCKLKFTELNTGWIDTMEAKGPIVTTGDVKIKATSVFGGEVIARACVVKDLSEISQLQRGDVLITHATDIGWSPYFPLLTGIVTELGGLISHGAVIAREYGLPCIVGAAYATDIFKTGDIVRLSGTKGMVEKVEVEEDNDIVEDS